MHSSCFDSIIPICFLRKRSETLGLLVASSYRGARLGRFLYLLGAGVLRSTSPLTRLEHTYLSRWGQPEVTLTGRENQTISGYMSSVKMWGMWPLYIHSRSQPLDNLCHIVPKLAPFQASSTK